MSSGDRLDSAAERVLRTRSARDARRHASTVTLERDYQRALEDYFELAERVMGRDPAREPFRVIEEPRAFAGALGPPSAPLEHDEAHDDEDDDSAVAERKRIAEAIARHYAAARVALALARRYRAEPGSSGRRERDCLDAVADHRDAILRLRRKARRVGEQLPLPGLVKARPIPASPKIARTR